MYRWPKATGDRLNFLDRMREMQERAEHDEKKRIKEYSMAKQALSTL